MHLCWWMHRVLVAALIAFWALSSVAHAEDSSEACEQFVAALNAALDSHDISKAANFFAEDTRVMAPGPINGRDAIAQWLFTQYGGPEATVEVSRFASNGQRVTWMTRLTRGARVQLTWDEALVVDGHITFWSSRGLGESMTVLPQFQRARTVASPDFAGIGTNTAHFLLAAVPPWLLMIGALAAVAEGALFGFWRQRYHPRPERQSRQGGRLLLRLRERVRA